MRTTQPRASQQAPPVHRGVTVMWHDATTDADAALGAHVAGVVGVPAGAVDVGRLCPRCGSADHGRPWASHGVHVSLARSGPHLVTAVSTTGPVGVDVECVADVASAWDDLSALLDPGTVVRGTRAALWCRTEAMLKRDGTGLSARRERRTPEDDHLVDDLAAPAGYCAAVAVTGL